MTGVVLWFGVGWAVGTGCLLLLRSVIARLDPAQGQASVTLFLGSSIARLLALGTVLAVACMQSATAGLASFAGVMAAYVLLLARELHSRPGSPLTLKERRDV